MGNTRIARLLIEDFGAEVDLKAETFGTALQAAAYQIDNAVVELLLESGATCVGEIQIFTR